MKKCSAVLLLISLPVLVTAVAVWLFFPYKEMIVLEEVRSEEPMSFYLPLHSDRHFQVNYTHSIHLTNVKEQYRVTDHGQLRFEFMQYEDVAIGLPGYAEEGETLDMKDGIYTLTFENRVIDSFVLYVGRVDTGLSLQYEQIDYNLKGLLQKGHSYDFHVAEVSNYDVLRGVRIDG